jgi:putative hemolysin
MGAFPAGEVATFRPRARAVLDPPWSPTVARLVRRSGATVVPIHFAGRNSLVFQALSQVHPLLRTLLLGRELLKKKGRTIRMRVGDPIPPEKLARFGGDRELIDYLRVRTCLLGEEDRDRHTLENRTVVTAAPKPIVPPVPREELEEEVGALAPDQRLAANGEMEVWLAPAERIPRILHEIGRLREFSFRAVGEGTGAAIDLDSFDRYYQHLFVWHRGEGAVVGAYRLGRTDEIVRSRGVQGLYTSTLFRFNRQLLSQIAPAVELGRSFVQPRYQQSYTPLLLLWRGIGRYVVENPECTGLFGPVSISNEYRDLSRRLMVSYLTETRLAPDLARLCRARNPLKRKNVAPDLHLAASGDIDSISEMISAIEGEPRGVPVLVRQYLKLGARFLGFNVDRDFGNALDGLLYVDLTRTSARILERYMGKEEAAAYLARHKGQVIPAA